MEIQRIAVVGVGAIGGAVAGDLADLARHDLTLCSRTPFGELVVVRPDGTTTARSPVATDPGEVEPVDWVLLATKAHQSEGARRWLERLCGPHTTVAILQNGVDHRERIAPLAPAGTMLLPVVVQLPAEKTAPGRIEQMRGGALIVPDEPAGRAFAALFEGGRIQVRATDGFAAQAWWKLVSNAALGGVCALLLRENGVAKEEPVRELVLALMREVAAVAAAAGAPLPDDAPEKALGLMLGAAPGHWSSIAVDRREGRPMEWQARNAVVGRLARLHGVETPLNDALTTLLRAVDGSAAADPGAAPPAHEGAGPAARR